MCREPRPLGPGPRVLGGVGGQFVNLQDLDRAWAGKALAFKSRQGFGGKGVAIEPKRSIRWFAGWDVEEEEGDLRGIRPAFVKIWTLF